MRISVIGFIVILLGLANNINVTTIAIMENIAMKFHGSTKLDMRKED